MSYLTSDIKKLKGIGEKRAELYAKLGINSPSALLSHYPRGYIDYTNPTPILDTISGGNLVELFKTIEDLTTRISSLEIENARLRKEVDGLNEWTNSQSEGGSGSTGGSTGGVGFGGDIVTDDGTYYMIVTDDVHNLYKVPTVRYEEAVFKSENGFYQ